MGYHKKEIAKGKMGDYSKIKEEFEELTDAAEQQNPVLVICELCDLIGAIEAFSLNYNLSLNDLIKMKDATKSAFLEGTRKP